MKATAMPASGESAAKQVAGFIAKFDPPVQKVLRAARAALRKRYPAAIEQVYDNYNFLAMGFGPTERTSDCLLSLATNAKGVGLCFFHGAKLPDPHKILLGSGNQTRFIRLPSAARLADPEVEELLRAAEAHAKVPMPAKGKGYTIVKSVAVKQRPRSLSKSAAIS